MSARCSCIFPQCIWIFIGYIRDGGKKQPMDYSSVWLDEHLLLIKVVLALVASQLSASG